MPTLFITLLCLVASSAFAADFNGTWAGKGSLENSTLGFFPMASVTIKIKQQDSNIVAEDCWKFLKDGNNWKICSSTELLISGTDLLFQGYKVGSISENRIEIKFNLEGSLIESSLEILPNETMNYTYKSTGPDRFYVKQNALGLIR